MRILVGLFVAALVVLATPAQDIHNSTPREKSQAVQAEVPRKEPSTSNILNAELRSSEKAQTEQQAEVEPEENAATVAIPAPQSNTPEAWMNAANIPQSEQEGYKELVARESSWNPHAVNPSSGSCGLAQELPCGKSGCQTGDPVCQLEWMRRYVKGRYGDVWSAISFHNANNWY